MPPKGRSNNPSGVVTDISKYIKRKTKGGKQVVDAMLDIAFGRGKGGAPVYEVKERWQALKWLGDHMDPGTTGDEPGETKVFVIDYSKVPDGS